jgi:hypothetical protein
MSIVSLILALDGPGGFENSFVTAVFTILKHPETAGPW